MKVIVIGGSGHVGTYLVPRLVRQGAEVVSVSRGQREPYTPDRAWGEVEHVSIDRTEEEKSGVFGRKIAAMKPDVVIDMINFRLESAQQIVEALRGQVSHYLYTSSVWGHGMSTVLPAEENQSRHPFAEYGIQKTAIEEYLQEALIKDGFPSTSVLPGHITGPGWACINPCGNFDPQVFGRIARGEEIAIPHFGRETVHHVHADDVAQVFQQAITHRKQAVGESFHAVSPQALSLAGFADAMYRWFGRTPNVRFLPWQEWCVVTRDEETIRTTYGHLMHSNVYSIEKGEKLIGYRPRYSSLQAVCECVDRLIANRVISVD